MDDSTQAQAVKLDGLVKPLVWSDGYRPASSPQLYQIWPDNGGSGAPDDPIENFDGFMLYSPEMRALGVHPSIEAAKAAAQADYTARILSAIDTDAIARAALEAAAEIADEIMRKYAAEAYDTATVKVFTKNTPSREQSAAKCYCAGEVANAIRAIMNARAALDAKP